ncbi:MULTISPECIES: DsbA family oxidoreductase [Sphingomonas]|uniref:DsbA family oxidoreductase n=1 Tax=Sphingomonas TaxID=13687 RepID=UPI00082E1BEB|nr:DsbA family oxidoreductase [Sphingomonas sp. CCH10-B3]
MTPKPMKIDFVSDVVCPWCIIGLRALEQAIEAASDVVAPTITFHPFELNPAMPPEGQNIVEHVAEKYGATPEQSAKNRAGIQARASELGFAMTGTADSRIYNTFDAHRLLHWAQSFGLQAALKNRLFAVYFSEGGNVSDAEVLVRAAADVGLDAVEARAVLAEGRYAEEVRAEERHWHAQGINAVPAIVINDRYAIMGGQPPQAFERALRKIAAEA